MNRKIQTKSTLVKLPSSSLAPRVILQKWKSFVQRREKVMQTPARLLGPPPSSLEMPSGAWLRPCPAAGAFGKAVSAPPPPPAPVCSECACGEAVRLLSSSLIPCLLSMHSERVVGFFFVVCVDLFGRGRLWAACPIRNSPVVKVRTRARTPRRPTRRRGCAC